MAKKKQSEPTTVAQETNVDLPEIVTKKHFAEGEMVAQIFKDEKVAPETISASTAEQTTATANSTDGTFTLTDDHSSSTITEVLPIAEETKTVEVETKLVPVVEEKTVVVDKEFLYRMLVGLSRGHVTYYTYAQVTGMVGKLFGVEGTDRQAKWDEIKEYIQKR